MRFRKRRSCVASSASIGGPISFIPTSTPIQPKSAPAAPALAIVAVVAAPVAEPAAMAAGSGSGQHRRQCSHECRTRCGARDGALEALQQFGAHHRAAAGEALAHGLIADPEQRGDLFGRAAFAIEEHEHFARIVRQLVQHGHEHAALFVFAESAIRGGTFVDGIAQRILVENLPG